MKTRVPIPRSAPSPPSCWASVWRGWFPFGVVFTKFHAFTWRGNDGVVEEGALNYHGNVVHAFVPQLTSLFNYYSTGDEVLSIYDTPDPGGSGKITIHPIGLGGKRYHSWQKQERFKGRWLQSALGGWGGTSDMGWGFSSYGQYTYGAPPLYTLPGDPHYPYVSEATRFSEYATNDAHAATADQLRADPVFNHEPPEILSGNLQTGDIDELLARGVPALSGPVGSRAISKLPADNNDDLNGKATPNSWPRHGAESWSGWRHSDIKDVAFPFMFSVFQCFHHAGNGQ